jgi:8-oxo-dGTP pyrophosphatase MutT (NUDIX family)
MNRTDQIETAGEAQAILARVASGLRQAPALGDIPAEFAARGGGDHELNPGSRPLRPGPLQPAAVLVPLVLRDGALNMLLTLRTEGLRHHSGQISFPGGKIEPGDSDVIACALRETREEIGLGPEFIDVLGALDLYVTITGFAVLPVVGLIRPGFSLELDRQEVAEVFEVPADFALDPGNHITGHGVFNGIERQWWEISYGGRRIWGATAGIIRSLYRSQKVE